MLKKETFVKAIEKIKEHREREQKFIEGLSALSPYTYNDTFLYNDYEAEVVDLLVEAMEDKDEIIPYFIYDLEFGTSEQLGLLVDHEKVDLSSAEKVYEYLAK